MSTITVEQATMLVTKWIGALEKLDTGEYNARDLGLPEFESKELGMSYCSKQIKSIMSLLDEDEKPQFMKEVEANAEKHSHYYETYIKSNYQ